MLVVELSRRLRDRFVAFSERWGVNVFLVAILYLSLYVWLPIASFLDIPVWVKGAFATLLYAAPFVYVAAAILWRVLRPSREFRLGVKDFKIDDIGGWAEMAKYFRQFWATAGPWGEYLRCHSCAEAEDGGMYDSVATYSFKDAKKEGLTVGSPCPVCGDALGHFWTAVSVEEYFDSMQCNKDFRGITGWIDNEMAGWHFSYALSESVWYLDTFAILKPFRGRPYRYPLLSIGFSEMLYAMRKGFRVARMRTHRRAIHVLALAKLFGYRNVGPDPRDPDRVYFEVSLSAGNLARVWILMRLLEASPEFEKRLSK